MKDESRFWASRQPALWLLHNSMVSLASGQETGNSIDEDDIWMLQRFLGQDLPFGGVNKKFPLCAPSRGNEEKTVPNGKSVILVILESVGTGEMFLTVDGRPLMPNLQRIASDSLFFPNNIASGTKSCQALPAIFSGLPPQTYANILWRRPLPTLTGLPAALPGYDTAYFHGSDLLSNSSAPISR